MRSFIQESVSYLYNKYGNEISNKKIVLPSKRASLFFNLELSRLIENRPIWQPKFYSIDNLFTELSGAVTAERLKLLVVLYNAYTKFHKESFDQFYYWGEMLLSDFDTIDNYMVDARLLFENSADIKDIELQFDYISEEDAQEISRFWTHFNQTKNSEEKEYFFNIWKSLYPIYCDFKQRLASEGIGYRGMICREMAEKLSSGEQKIENSSDYVIVGFNALSNTEKILFDSLPQSEFLWDSDDSYLNNKNSEAGLFLRQNITRYGESNISTNRDNFRKQKDITIVKSPSASMECKYVWEFLTQCAADGRKLGSETAIVLTDESLLLPVLYSIPPFIEHFNVTAGYDLRLTQAYSLTESLISLQVNYKDNAFYYKDVDNILSNPLIANLIESLSLSDKEIYFPTLVLQNGPFTTRLFTKMKGWEAISDYLLFLFNAILRTLSDQTPQAKEAIFRAFNTVASLKALIGTLNIELSDHIFFSLLRKHLGSERISFEGEPLLGIQIMGILESRTLDFENVLILSVGEENFPSKSMGASFIPSNLRHGYGLPTNIYHQSIYSYYFYRLIQRAKRVDISYISMSNDLSSGEPSRYIHQLLYANEHHIKQLELSLNLTTSDVGESTMPKNKKSTRYLEGIIKSINSLSASSLYNYIECPMRFYYTNIEKLKDEDEQREKELDAIESGNALHYSLEKIYKPLEKITHSQLIGCLKKIKTEDIVEIVDGELKIILGTDNFDANVKHSRKSIVYYISTIIKYDLSRTDNFTIECIEEELNETLIIGDKKVRFTGRIDRVDKLPSGLYMIIDYKSGKGSVINSISSLFNTNEEFNNKAAMQAILYSLLYASKYSVETIPALYYVREMNKKDFSPLLALDRKTKLYRLSDVKEEYMLEITTKITELLDFGTPFYKCDSESKCKYCNFRDLCSI